MSNLFKYSKTPDGSVINSQGKTLFFSVDRFKRDICEGDCCFICGASPSETDFNDEHIIPRWILRDLNLFSKTIHLPNGLSYQYDRYKVPCCISCNSLLGEEIEQPVSDLIKGNWNDLNKHLKEKGPWLFFKWFTLLFIKTHLRDKTLHWKLNRNLESPLISDSYDWEELHNIHCISRSFYTGAKLDASTLGTFFFFPAHVSDQIDQFDYFDLYTHRAVCFRFRDKCIVSVLNDSCACYSLESSRLFSKIKGPLYPLQIRELMTRLAYLNLLIKQRPQFQSDFEDQSYRISATHPNSIEVEDWDQTTYGKLLYKTCAPLLDLCSNSDIEEIKDQVLNGTYTFLFNEDGDFIKEQMVYKPIVEE